MSVLSFVFAANALYVNLVKAVVRFSFTLASCTIRVGSASPFVKIQICFPSQSGKKLFGISDDLLA